MNSYLFFLSQSLFQSISAFAAIGTALASLVGAVIAFRSTKNREVAPPVLQEEAAGVARRDSPFEVLALSRYYNQALNRADLAFVFSMMFASIGFGVIIFAFLSHNSNDMAGTVIKVISGTIIDAVSGLFFVQSTNAQKNMSEFFEKLRLDRLNASAREIMQEIENADLRDDLRAQLVLKYSGIERRQVLPRSRPKDGGESAESLLP